MLIGQSQKIATWAATQIPWMSGPDGFGPCEAWGILSDEKLVGALVFSAHDRDVGDLFLHAVSLDGNWTGPEVWQAVSDYVFNMLGCERLSMILPKGAKKTRDAVERLGFVMEGVRRRAFHGGVNAIMYGMLREECRWLPQHRTRAAA